MQNWTGASGRKTLRQRRKGRQLAALLLFAAAWMGLAQAARAQGNQSLYTDSLSAAWQNWSWCRTDFSAADYAHTGARSLKVSIDAAGEGLYLHCSPQSDTLYGDLVFWIHGGVKSGRKLAIAGVSNSMAQLSVSLNAYIDGGVVAAGKWSRVVVPLADLRVNNIAKLSGFQIVDTSGGPQLPFFMDDITLAAGTVPRPPLAPLNLIATAGDGEIPLAWTPSMGANTYSVKRSAVPNGPYTLLASGLSGTSYVDVGLGAGTTWYYVVTAISLVGESSLSNQASATVLPTPFLTGLFSTGLDNYGLPLGDGLHDPHYAIVSNPSGSVSAPFVTLQKFPIQYPLWIADTPLSKWISPRADESAYNDLPGMYVYQTTFSVTGDPTRVGVVGRALADQQITGIVLNGVTVVGGLPGGCATWANFALTSGFIVGTNTLRFAVYNDSASGTNPSGFRCELTPYSY